MTEPETNMLDGRIDPDLIRLLARDESIAAGPAPGKPRLTAKTPAKKRGIGDGLIGIFTRLRPRLEGTR